MFQPHLDYQRNSLLMNIESFADAWGVSRAPALETGLHDLDQKELARVGDSCYSILRGRDRAEKRREIRRRHPDNIQRSQASYASISRLEDCYFRERYLPRQDADLIFPFLTGKDKAFLEVYKKALRRGNGEEAKIRGRSEAGLGQFG